MKQCILKTVALMALILVTSVHASAAVDKGTWEQCERIRRTLAKNDQKDCMSFNYLKSKGSDVNFYYKDREGYGQCVNYDLHSTIGDMGVCFTIYKYTLKVEPHTVTEVKLTFDIIAGLYDTREDLNYSLTEVASLDGDLENAKAQDLWVNAQNSPDDSRIVCYARCNNSLTTTKADQGLKATVTKVTTVTFDNLNGSDWKVFERYFIMVFSGHPKEWQYGHTYGGMKSPTIGTPTVTKRALRGDGSQNNPFLITNADDLIKFRNMVNNANHPDYCARLTADIDMGNSGNWIPICRFAADSDKPYTGIFNGDGYTISNLHSDIDSSKDKFHDTGLIGRSGAGCVVKNLLMNNVSLKGHMRSAPIVGQCSGKTTIENCGVLGKIELSLATTISNGLDGLAYGGTLNYCYTTFPAKSCIGGSSGYSHDLKGTYYYGDSIEKMLPGQLCYKLNKGASIDPIWFQDLNTMSYPIQNRGKGKIVHKTGPIYHNGVLPFSGTGSEADPFIITSGKNLSYFTALVNLGYNSLCATLGTNIDYTAYKADSNMIGTDLHRYKGVFNGNGKDVKIDFSTESSETGLFRYVENATIGNLHLTGSIQGVRLTASLIGMAYGSTTVTHVISDVNVTSSHTSDAACSGLVAGVNGTLSIDYSAFRGCLLGEKADHCAGFIGLIYQNSRADISNSYFAPQEVTYKTDGSCTFARSDGNNKTAEKHGLFISNSYYTKQFGTAQGEKLTTEQMKSGEGCFKLNGSSNDKATWLQTLGQDNFPTLWNSQRVFRWGDKIYSNVKCDLPGAGTPADPLLIGSATDLELFRDLVNNTASPMPSLCARLTADIDMRDRNWEPIGRWTTDDKIKICYNGNFDGDGYVISDLSGESATDKAMGLIGYAGKDCNVYSLIMNNVHLQSAVNCAPVIGYTTDKCSVQYCGVTGLVKMESSDGKGLRCGLVVDKDKCVQMKGCYTVSPSIRPGETTNDETNNNYCNVNTGTMASSGELCYKLNGKNENNYRWLQTIGKDPYPMQRTGLKVDYKDGKYGNIDFTDKDNSVFKGPLGSSDLKIIHHGGHLYEFVVTLGTKDGLGYHPFPDMKLYYKENGSWIDIATLKNINREKLPFNKDWSGEITIDKGTFINPHTFETQTPVFWIMQGNHTSKKAASLLWLAPNTLTTLPVDFMVESTNASTTLQMSNSTINTVAPTGANAVTKIDPYINALATNLPGSAAAKIINPNKVYSLGVWDITDDKFISAQEITAGTNDISITLPQQDRIHEIVAIMYGQQINMIGLEADTTYVTYAVPLKQKPLHSIRRNNLSVRYNEYNAIKWGIAFPQDSDIIDGDRFTVYRAYQSDFSDATALEYFGIEDFTSTAIEGDTLNGWYAYTDSTKEGQSTSVVSNKTLSAFDGWNLKGEAKTILTAYKYPARYIYYGVERTTATNIWGKSDMYWNTWKVLLTNVLPKVDTIKVVKAADWNTTHRVELRLTLNNPHPEDLVPTEYKQDVINEAKAQGFNGRMFLWDENAKIVITRFSPQDEWYKGVDEVAKTITIDGSDVKLDDKTGNYYAVVTDIQSAPETHYYYKAQVDNSGSDFPVCSNMTTPAVTTKAEAEACFSEIFVGILNFKASRGTDIGLVNLSWDGDNAESMIYTLKKSIYDVPYSKTPVLDDGSETGYLRAGNGTAQDGKAKAGKVYRYDLNLNCTFRGKTKTSNATAYGWSDFQHGNVSGYVTMPNGTVIPGDVNVTITRKYPEELSLRTITTPDGKEVIFPGLDLKDKVTKLKADNKGFYHTETLPYYGSGVQYTVSAQCEGASFLSSTGTSTDMTLTLEDANYSYEDVDFICSNTKQFSGRILYEGSTVPARGVEFKVNGIVLTDREGQPVTTDAMGNFSFRVPAFEVSIQAYKPGHTLKDDGYILGGEKKDQKKFTPTKDYDGLLLYDQTKVRLVGRVVGGNTEGSKPVGFGLSANNLGDNITLMLQLEGDNTSYIYYNTNNPDETSKKGTSFQEVLFQRDDKSTVTVNTCNTKVTYHSKSIVINADSATGEFCIDLFPTIYKVSQLTAQGYSTLYREGEGLQTIDLTNAVNAMQYADAEKKAGTTYAAAFNHIYHTDAKVTLTQDEPKNGGWVGDSLICVSTVFGKQNIQTAWKDNNGIHYTFGHPVFQGGKKYTFTAKAVEEYHYNNVSAGRLSTSPLQGDSLIISNGLTSGSQTIKGKLNLAGKCSFTIEPSNTTFSFKGENALFSLSAAVKVNNWSYESEPIKGYVTGSRDMGVAVQAALESAPTVLDVIRDPYGSGSYAYREKGTTYTWSQHFETQTSKTFYLNLSAGVAFLFDVGIGWNVGQEIDLPLFNLDINCCHKNNVSKTDGEYTMTVNDRITTSSDPLDVGAMADLYVGKVNTMDIKKSQVFTVLDENTYKSLSDAEKSGALTKVCKGTDSKKNTNYLVVGQALGTSLGKPRVFIYSQKYIISTLIPEFERQRDLRKRMAKNESEAQDKANETGLTYYYLENDTSYVACFPDSSSNALTTDSVKLYNERIEQWEKIIRDNEELKYKTLNNGKSADLAYSFTQSVIEHTESASSYYRAVTYETPRYTVVSGGVKGSTKGTEKNKDTGSKYSNFKGFGVLFDISAGCNNNESQSNAISNYQTAIGGSGFCLSAPDNSNLDMDVYRITDDNLVPISSSFKSFINKFEGGQDVNGYKQTNGGKQLMDDNNSCVHNYIFVQRGGSTRNPWSDADSTFYYKPNGKRVPLGARTLRIDNPKIYVENPIVNNQPQDEPAVFTIRLANETEINENTKYLNPSTLYLNVDEPSNPYGAKLTIDGQPLRNHMEFYLNPGQSAVKTLEVERGGKPYDYENIKLQFTDNPDLWTLCDEATISVHYQPVSSPVNLSLPADNWLMNTLSQKDNDGKYYIPVQIDGFSTTKYDNFDHIELQYKKQTEGEDQWVNLCSYYADKQLYNKATGTKAMIQTEGKIENIRFYGEKDPIEMKYDLRAVSFCRLGTSYITRYSKVVSGTKDTRCPEVFGKPSPADGILDFDDIISLPFTEPIAYNYLDETVNFSVQGYTNNSDADHSAYIHFPGTSSQSASTKVTRETALHDFTIEMMVKVKNDAKDTEARFFTLGSNAGSKDVIAFGYRPNKNCLMAIINGTEYESVNLSKWGNLSSAMTHVAMSYSAKDSIVQFIVGQNVVGLSGDCRKSQSRAAGLISIGSGLKGDIADIRLWNRKLSESEMASKYNKTLSTSEKGLLSYWPMKEAQGNILYDVTGGADLYLTDVTWQTPTGYSVRLDKKPLTLTKKAIQQFTRSNSEDYTIAFWFRADANAANANAMLFSAGSDGLDEKGSDKMRIGFVNGEMLFRSEGNNVQFGATISTLSASVWHYAAVSVSHSLNIASLFLDGKMVNEISADYVGGIAGSYVAFGDKVFSGNIDNISLWSMALPASYIYDSYNTDFTGREPELLVNLNFEQQVRNDQGSLSIAFSPMNNVIVKSTGKIAGDTLVSECDSDAERYAPVRAGAGLQNIPFTWTSTDNALQINLKKADADINHQQLNLVVRNVEDANGNPMKNACMWSVYVNRNVLEWEKSTETLYLQYGEGASVEVSWKNKSGRILSYSLDNEATWLHIDNTFGTMQPLSEASANLTVDDGLSPGCYRTEVYLTDEDNLVSKMTLTVNVEAKAPVWNVVDATDYPSTMQIIAQVKKKDVSGSWAIDMSEKDIVAAFIDTLCLGKAYLSVDKTLNTSHLFLNIAGSDMLNDNDITFRLWDSETVKVHILQTGTSTSGTFVPSSIKYSDNSISGADTPVEMRTTDSKMQVLQLSEGWNWVSFNVNPSSTNGLNGLFSDCIGFSKDDVFKHPGNEGFATYSGNGAWVDGIKKLTHTENNVYQIYKQQAGEVTVSGTAFEDDNRTVTLSFNSEKRWSELAYLLDVTQPIGIALSDMPASSDKAPAGTVIKTHHSFAVARNDGHWFGSLEYLRPGEGYYVLRSGADSVRFTVRYTNTSVQAEGTKASLGWSSGVNADKSTVDADYADALAAKLDGVVASSEHSQSMPVIATFAEGIWQQGDILVALVNGDVAGVSEAIIDGRNGKPYFFLSVNASDESVVRFVRVHDGSVAGESRNSLTFNGDQVIGTLDSPYLIDFTETVSEGVYDATGIKYQDENHLNNRRGVYIINGQKIVK